MQANKAPEKIYLKPLLMEDGESIVRRCTFERQCDSQIEYVRADAFIEKSKKYLEERFINEVSIIAGGPVVIHFNQAFENFIKYMKGV